MAKRILITGASGLLGRKCYQAFASDSTWQTQGLAHSRAGENFLSVDLTRHTDVADVVKKFKPTVILHSAAERRPDVVEKDEEATVKLNVDATQNLCDLANEVGAYVLYISTDYVFDGTKPPYQPSDAPNPLNKYGATKARGETVVLDASPGNTVVRVPVLYGDVEFIEESAVTILFKKVLDIQNPAKMNHREKRYPTSCEDLANAMKLLVDSQTQDPELSGIFHLSANEMMTKYDMSVTMAKLFGISTEHLIPDTEIVAGAPRPMDCRLDCSRIEQLGFTAWTSFAEGIKAALDKYKP